MVYRIKITENIGGPGFGCFELYVALFLFFGPFLQLLDFEHTVDGLSIKRCSNFDLLTC